MLAISKKRNLFLSIVLMFGLGFLSAGCESWEKVAGSTIFTTAIGAGIGAILGDPAMGAAIGAGAGAVGGTLWAASTDTDDKSVSSDDVEKLKKLSGVIMTADQLSQNLVTVGVSSKTKNAIMVDVRAITQGSPNAKFIVNMNGHVQQVS
jgi:hypothetical protein